jgi:hypothetical protein
MAQNAKRNDLSERFELARRNIPRFAEHCRIEVRGHSRDGPNFRQSDRRKILGKDKLGCRRRSQGDLATRDARERARPSVPRADEVIVEILDMGEADDAFYVAMPGDFCASGARCSVR